MRTPTPEEFDKAIAKLETELTEIGTEWENASKSDRYWIDEAIEDIEAKISRYKVRRNAIANRA